MVNKNLTKAGAVKAAPKTAAKAATPVTPAPKGAPAPAPSAVTRAPTYPVTAIITLTPKGAAGNPKVPGSGAHALYAAYGKGGITVGAYINAVKAGGVRTNCGRSAIAWDLARGFITVS